jgi:transglutaminase-like putative cysteine protease
MLTAAVLTALVAALLPVARVIESGAWLVGAVGLAGLVLAAGYNARRFRLPAIAVTLIEAAVWVIFMTLVFLRDTAFVWVIPTADTVRAVPRLVEKAMEEITLGAAPLEPSLALGFVVVGAMGLLAIVIDHVVVTARMPLLASIGVVAVSLIPSIAVPGDVEIIGFVLLAVAILFLIRAETRSREKPLEQEAERSAGVPATAIAIGAIAVVVAVVATPLLPQPEARAGAGVGPGPGIDATLQLGDDLRRPQDVEVLRLRTDSPVVPYLRATTLTRFDGGVWEPDRPQSISLASERSLGELTVGPDIRTSEYSTSVQVVNLDTLWAPVPFPAVSVAGLDGEWSAVPYNRTVVARSGSTQGQDYDVVSSQPRPTLEQIRALAAGGEQVRDETTQLPADIPEIIGQLAAEVTAEASNDYDRLIALQRWFRGSDFRYSLDAPVEEGFDGSGAEAVAQFLEQREGYCIHFASAFALMARTLHMPARIVVGYLPGQPTTDSVDGQPVYSVSSSQLHAWPEVYFGGVGWIAFEPTSGLGVPTSFAPAAALPGQLGDPGVTTPGTAQTPAAPTATTAPGTEQQNGGTASGASDTQADPLPALGVLLLAVLVLGLPFLLGQLRRRQLEVAARRGDVAAAWQSVQDAAIDLGIPVPASESVRVFGTRLVREHAAPPSEMGLLVTAVERASYARGGKHGFGQGDAAMDAANAVRAAMVAAVDPSKRLLAFAMPRSLIVRPGSVYAGSAAARELPIG